MENPFSLTICRVKVYNVEKPMKKIKLDKAAGEERVIPRLMKMAGSILFKLFSDVTSTAITTLFQVKQSELLLHQLKMAETISTYTLNLGQRVY